MRLVYERVPHRHVRLQPATFDGLRLAETLEVAPGQFERYLRDQLTRRADHRCAESLDEFRAAQRAVTMQGQVRSGDRHEKDDRSRIDDPRTWVLGWANERKIEALTEQLVAAQDEYAAVQETLSQFDAERAGADARLTALGVLEQFPEWRELNWAEARSRAAAADEERERLLAGSARLGEIEGLLKVNEARTSQVRARLEKLQGEISVLEHRIGQASRAREQEREFVAAERPGSLDAARAVYDELKQRLGRPTPVHADDCSSRAADMTSGFQRDIDRLNKEIGGYAQSLLAYMGDVRRRWPEATTAMDASVEARGEYRAFRNRVADDDLPAFEEEFKRQLNTNTIRELAGFASWLRRQADEIHGRVNRINDALGAVPFNEGRYIKLVAERTVNQEVQAFRTESAPPPTTPWAPTTTATPSSGSCRSSASSSGSRGARRTSRPTRPGRAG
jgi:uncharacterized protein YPO0396